MAKQTGLRSNIYVDGYNISGDFQAISRMNGGPAPIVTTGIDKEAVERLGGQRDGNLDAVTFFNPDTDQSHLVLSPLPLADRVLSMFHLQSGETFSLVAKQGNYDPTRAADGSLTVAVNSMANSYGAEWGHALTDGPVTHTEADEEASLDGLAASAFGAQAWLHVFDFTGTDCTIAIQSSSDNGVGDAWADIAALTFTEVTAAPFAERIQTARNAAVERYLRVATTGTFDSITFAVSVTRNQTVVNF